MIFSEWKNIQAAPALSILEIWKNAKAFFCSFWCAEFKYKIFLARAHSRARCARANMSHKTQKNVFSRHGRTFSARTYNARRWICMIK